VTISGPAGVHASTAGGKTVYTKPFLIYPVAAQDTTYIAILHPAAGSYTITTNPASAAIARVLQADGINPSVTARVSDRKGHLRLSYELRPEPGQRVVLMERSQRVFRVIGSTTAAHGALALNSAPGPGGTRQILAEIIQNGAPVVVNPGARGTSADQLIVATYRAPGPRRLSRVTQIHVRHLDTRVLVSFGGVRGANRYAVTLTLSSGQHLVYLIARHTLTSRRRVRRDQRQHHRQGARTRSS